MILCLQVPRQQSRWIYQTSYLFIFTYQSLQLNYYPDKMLLQSYSLFIEEISNISFSKIEEKFVDFTKQSLSKWMLPQYIPKLHQYSLQLDQHKRQEQKMKTVPTFNGKKSYDNNENLHRKIIGLFKDFLASQHKNICQFLRLTIDIDQLSIMISKIQTLRFKNSQYNLIYYLFTAGKRTIRLFLKLREQIIKTNTFEKNKFLPISIHNPAKYSQKYVYLDSILIPAKQWKQIINLAGFQYDQQFLTIIFDHKPVVDAVEVIKYCLWLNRQYASLNSSPTKT